MIQIYIETLPKQFRGDDTSTYQILRVPIDNRKIIEKIQFHPSAPVINITKIHIIVVVWVVCIRIYCFVDEQAVTALVNCIEESLTLQTDIFKKRIHFANAIMTNITKIKGENYLIYNMKVWHKNYALNILKNISEYVTLLKLIESLVNVNNDIIILGYWVFDSNYDKALCPTQESLDLICYYSVQSWLWVVRRIFYDTWSRFI